MIVAFYHPEVGEWILTQREFTLLMRGLGYRKIENYKFLRTAWERERKAGRIPFTAPFSSFVQWNLAVVSGVTGGIEFRLSKLYYRLMFALMFYAKDFSKKKDTPDPFADFRAWTIIPREMLAERKRIFDKLEEEAYWLPTLFFTMEDAIGQYEEETGAFYSAMDHVKTNASEKQLLLGINIIRSPATRIGWEVREIDGSENEITVEEANYGRMKIARGAAFYKKYKETWRDPHRKYDEWWIKGAEVMLLGGIYSGECSAIKLDFGNLDNFKKFASARFKKAVELINKGDNYTAYKLIEPVYAYIKQCVRGFYITEKDVRERLGLTDEDFGVEL